jgi:hypothetical protein
VREISGRKDRNNSRETPYPDGLLPGFLAGFKNAAPIILRTYYLSRVQNGTEKISYDARSWIRQTTPKLSTIAQSLRIGIIAPYLPS